MPGRDAHGQGRWDVSDVSFWRMEDAEGRSDDFLAMDVPTTFLLSRTSQGEEPLDTGSGRGSLPRCLFWSSGHC